MLSFGPAATKFYIFGLFVFAFVISNLSPRPAIAITIGFSQFDNESEWRIDFSNSLVRAASDRGITLLLDNAEGQQANQIAAIRSFIARQVDIVLIAPIVVDGWDQVLREAKIANIPVFIVDRWLDASPNLYVARFAADFTLEGKIVAAWLAQETRGVCRIIQLEGTLNSSLASFRKRGFEAVIALFPGMRIFASEVGDFTREGGMSAMTRVLTRRTIERALTGTTDSEEICAVFAHNDDMILGAIDVMKAHGLDPGKSILTVSVDKVREAEQALNECVLNATVELKSDIGELILDNVISYVQKKAALPKWVLIPSDVFVQGSNCKKS